MMKAEQHRQEVMSLCISILSLLDGPTARFHQDPVVIAEAHSRLDEAFGMLVLPEETGK